MEKVQKDANANMRAVLVDWLVEVVEEYKLLPDTLHLSVSYIDKYLSINVDNNQKHQLLGVASMFIASKYEEITPPNVDELCDITENGTKNKTLGLSKISQTPNISMDPELKSIISHLAKLKKAMAESDQQPEEAYAIKLQGDVPRYVLGPLYPLQPPDEVVKIWAEQSDDPPPLTMEFDWKSTWEAL
ncbi:cyclin-A2-1-like [Prunus avium]|uniref:B-like cyclin n=1 Tax=Prunus avium TaxID=42229 RepID=A0A6P5SH55_PRUAV|nr:cyclin-A2-1-like [Prunus avium]